METQLLFVAWNDFLHCEFVVRVSTHSDIIQIMPNVVIYNVLRNGDRFSASWNALLNEYIRDANTTSICRDDFLYYTFYHYLNYTKCVIYNFLRNGDRFSASWNVLLNAYIRDANTRRLTPRFVEMISLHYPCDPYLNCTKDIIHNFLYNGDRFSAPWNALLNEYIRNVNAFSISR